MLIAGDVPLSTFGELLATHERGRLACALIADRLDREHLVAFGWVCRAARAASGKDPRWRNFCEELWAHKTHVAPAARALFAARQFRAAFFLAISDSRRTYITRAELSAFTWHSRIKLAAGSNMTARDPWRRGLPATTMRFLPSGRCEQTPGGGSGSSPRVTASWTLAADDTHGAADAGISWTLPSAQRRARAGNNASGQAEGNVLKLRPAGVDADLPALLVTRHRASWGFVLDSAWSVCTSFPLPTVNSYDPELDESALAMTHVRQSKQIARFVAQFA